MTVEIDDLPAAILLIVLATGLIFISVILGTLIGAFVGWVIEYTPFLGEWVKAGFTSFGFKNVDLVQVGAMLGFVCGFFSSRINARKQ